MTFAAFEESIEQGRTISLYRFSLAGKFWYYTSADADIMRSSKVWKAIPISDSGYNQTGEAATDALTITCSMQAIPAQIHGQYPPSQIMTVSVFETHEGDQEVRAKYAGEITAGSVVQPGAFEFTCEDLSTIVDRAGLRFVWQRNCGYALYDPATCKVDKSLYAVPATVTEIDGGTITLTGLSGQPDGRFNGGYVEWTDPVRGQELRAVEVHEGDQLLMFGAADGLEVGLDVFVYPGCARNTDACGFFNNLGNYGGIPAMQGESPFDGNPVFY